MTDEIKIRFEPGCFDDFDGTQEELDAFVNMIKDLVQSDEFQARISEVEEGDYIYDAEEAAEILEKFKGNANRTVH